MKTKPLAPSAAELNGNTESSPSPQDSWTNPSKNGSCLLFSYGTLKKGHKLNAWVGDQMLIGEAVMEGACLINAGPYPIMVVPAIGSVKGELYLVSAQRFAALEQMEHAVGYTTAVRKVKVVDSEQDSFKGQEYNCKTFVFTTHEGLASWENVSDDPKNYKGQVTYIQQ